MSTATLIIAGVAIQVVLVGLDLLDRFQHRHTLYDGERARFGTLLFLLAVLVLYAGLQYGGAALLPGLTETLHRTQTGFSEWLGRPTVQSSLDGWWGVALAVGAFYVGGLWDYLVHRFISHSRLFWCTHEYHHLPNQVCVLMPGLAARPFSFVATFPVTVATVGSLYALLAVCGLPLWDLSCLKLLLLAQVFVLTYTHSSFLRRYWWVHAAISRLAVTTPQEHVLHHTVDLQGNYGNFTTLWDRLFGTYLDPALQEHQGRRLGLAYDQDFLGAVTLGRWKLPPRWRRRFQVERYCNLDRTLDGDARP